MVKNKKKSALEEIMEDGELRKNIKEDNGMAVKPTTKTLTAVKAAELVENVEGDSLRLDYITELDDGAAEALAKFKGDLYWLHDKNDELKTQVNRFRK